MDKADVPQCNTVSSPCLWHSIYDQFYRDLLPCFQSNTVCHNGEQNETLACTGKRAVSKLFGKLFGIAEAIDRKRGQGFLRLEFLNTEKYDQRSLLFCDAMDAGKLSSFSFRFLGPVVRSMVSANHWLNGIKINRLSWYLTLVGANQASSNSALDVDSVGFVV